MIFHIIINPIEKTYYNFEGRFCWQRLGKPVRQAYMTDLLNVLIESGQSINSYLENLMFNEF